MNISLGSDFLTMTPKVKYIQMESQQTEKYLQNKGNNYKVKRQPTA